MPSLGQLLGQWSFEPVPMLLALLAASAYGWTALRRARRWPLARTAAFLAGLALLVFALGSGLDSYGDELLSIHMLQHLVLTLVAPPLIVLGRPLELALRVVHGSGRRALARVVRVPPAVGWTAFTAVMLGTHLPPFYDAALRHPALHELEHALYLASALLFWAPLLDSRQRFGMVGRLLYAMLAMPAMAVVGVWLGDAQHVVYSAYPAPARELGVSALSDQARAGAIMWVGGTALMAAAAIGIAWQALVREEERARRREAYEDAELSA